LWAVRGALALILMSLWSCKRLPAEPPPAAAPVVPPVTAQFEEVSARLGLDFVHTHGGCGAKLFVEQLGSGCAFLDYDNDGWQDILLLRCAPLPGCPASPIPGSSVVLYRNEQGRRFRDVTRQAGLHIFGSALGCSVADYDNDGYPDIYVTGYGRNWLFRNTGARESSERAPIFQEVTSRAGVAVGGMSTSSAWLDFDGDGWLDLYVCRYVRWTPARDLRCDSLGQRAYCPPDHYPAETNRLYRNNRDGTFTDVTARAGVAGEGGRSLGVVIADVEDDNRPDIFVANDRSPNFLFRNRGDGTFADLSAPAGIALPDTARPKAGMGVDLIDLDGSGLPGIIIGNFNYESLTLFHNTGRGYFQDVTFPRGLGEPSHPFLTWSVFSFDYDLDGVSDLFAANGHIQDNIAQVAPDVAYAERPLLFRGDGAGAFVETGELCGLTHPLTARGRRGAILITMADRIFSSTISTNAPASTEMSPSGRRETG
jgi:hypothetical protein